MAKEKEGMKYLSIPTHHENTVLINAIFFKATFDCSFVNLACSSTCLSDCSPAVIKPKENKPKLQQSQK